MRRELDGLPDSIDDPAQDKLACSPTTIPFEHFLERDSLITVLFGDGRLREDGIQRVEKVPADDVHAFLPSLPELDEVIHEDIVASQRTLEHHVGRRSYVRRIGLDQFCCLGE